MPILSNDPRHFSFSSMMEEAKRRIQEGDSQSFVYIVPNRIAQRRLERELVEAGGGRGITKPNIITLSGSFGNDFAGRLSSVHFPGYRLLTDAETAVLIEKAIHELLSENNLHYFERALDSDFDRGESYGFPIPRGTFEQVVNTVRRLKESGVTVADLEATLKQVAPGQERSTEVRRSEDMVRIYAKYMEVLIEKKMMDTYGQTLLLNEAYRMEHPVKDFRQCFPEAKDIFIDGFYHFERPAIELLTSMADIPDLRLYVHLDVRENEALFQDVRVLEAAFIDRGFHRIGETSQSGAGSEIDVFRTWIGAHLFAGEKEFRPTLAAAPVVLWTARDAAAEAEEIARKVKRVCEEDPAVRLDLSRIVVATPSVEQYTDLFTEAFRRNAVPVQIADRYRLDRSPLVLTVLSLVDIARHGLRKKNLVHALSSPYFDFRYSGSEEGGGQPIDARNLLDVFVRFKPSGTVGGWKKSLNVTKNDILRQIDESDEEMEHHRLLVDEGHIDKALQDLDLLLQIIAPFSRTMRPREFCTALHRLLDRLGVREKLVEHSSVTLGAATLELDVRAYKAFTGLVDDLESLFTLLGAAETLHSVGYYIDRLKAAAIWVRYTTRPRHGAVLVTSLAQSISQPADYLFVGGLSEGAFPTVYQPQVFLMDAMQKGEKRHLMEDRVLFYQAITNVRNKLFLSYPKQSLGGSERSRSIFLDALEDIVELKEDVPCEGIYSYRDLFLRAGAIVASSALDVLPADHSSAGHGSMDHTAAGSSTTGIAGVPQWKALLATLPPTAEYTRTLEFHIPRTVLASRKRSAQFPTIYRGELDLSMLSEGQRAALEYNKRRIWSITQLELYASCPFRYFSKYVMRLRAMEEGEDGLDAMDRGSALHEILREFLTTRRDKKLPLLRDLSETDLEAAYEEIHTIAINSMNSRAKDHPFYKLDADRLVSKTKDNNVLWKFIDREKELGAFTPQPHYFEVSFGGETGRTSESDDQLFRKEAVDVGGISLRGKIDRIDIDESQQLFTIVDYKTGKTTPKLADITRGLSLQLPLYLRVAEDLLRTHLPEMEGMAENVNRAIEYTGVAALYHNLLDENSKRSLGLALKKYVANAFEEFGKKKNNVNGIIETPEEMAQIIEATVEKAKSFVDGIAAGKFQLVEKDLEKKVCTHCPYTAVCRVTEAKEMDVLS